LGGKLFKNFETDSLITPTQAARLNPIDQRSIDAGSLGINPDGLISRKNNGD
jgi:hypothetical protein